MVQTIANDMKLDKKSAFISNQETGYSHKHMTNVK